MVVKHINMKWTIVIGLLSVGSLYAGGDELPTLGESVETISKLEHAGKWKEALPIYRKLYEEARHAIDGLSVMFMLKKGICELQCGEFNDAEKSFEWITKLNEIEGDPSREALDRASAAFYLAETQARNGKGDALEKSLAAANRFFDTFEEYRRDPTMQQWRNHRVAKIRATKPVPSPSK